MVDISLKATNLVFPRINNFINDWGQKGERPAWEVSHGLC